MNPVKVLVLSHMYPRKGYPASGIFIHQQLKALKMVGIEPIVCNPLPLIPKFFKFAKKFTSYDDLSYSVIDGIEVFRPRYLHLPGAWFSSYAGYSCFFYTKKFIASLKKKYNFNLIHAHVVSPGGLCGIKLGKYLGIPVIVNIIGSDINIFPFKNHKTYKMTQNVLNSANAVISVSRDLKKKAKKIAGKEINIKVIHNGVDTQLFKPQNKQSQYSLNNGNKVILFVGRIEKNKGVFDLIKAISLLRNKKKIILFLIGELREKDNLQKYIKMYSLEGKVIYLGTVPHKKVAEFMNNSDLFVLPSYNEGVPNVILEAMSCGKPVISTNVGGIPEVISHGINGLLIEPRNIEQLADSILKVLCDKSLARKMGERARLTVCNKFSWEQNAKKNLELYNNLLA